MEEAPREFLFSLGAFAGATEAEGVDQGEEGVEGGIPSGGGRHAGIKGFDGGTGYAPLGVRPDRRQLIASLDLVRQTGRRPGGG